MARRGADAADAAWRTTPFLLLSEAIDRLCVRATLAAWGADQAARALANLDLLMERARRYGVRGLKQLAPAKGREWPVVIPINMGSELRRLAVRRRPVCSVSSWRRWMNGSAVDRDDLHSFAVGIQPRPHRKARAQAGHIREQGDSIATGCDEGDREQAEKTLFDYIARKYESPSGPCSPDQMMINRALEIYGRKHAPHVAAPRIIGFAIDALSPFWGALPVSAIKGVRS